MKINKKRKLYLFFKNNLKIMNKWLTWLFNIEKKMIKINNIENKKFFQRISLIKAKKLVFLNMISKNITQYLK